MTPASAVPEPTPALKNPELASWFNDAIKAKQDEGLTLEQIADGVGVSRQHLNRLRGVGGPQSIPGAETLVDFCEFTGADIEQAYRHLGQGAVPSASAADRKSLEAMQAIVEVLEDEHADEDDKDELLAQLRFLAAQYRARNERRREGRDDSAA